MGPSREFELVLHASEISRQTCLLLGSHSHKDTIEIITANY